MIGSKWFLVAPALSFVISAAAPSPNEAKSSCAAANDWATANAAALPRTYKAFVKYDFTYRKAIYAKLSASDRVELWTEHLNEYLVPSAGLNADQRAFVKDVIARLPVFIDDNVTDGAFKGSSLTDRATGLFGGAAASAMFFELGGDSGRSLGSSASKVPTDKCTCASDYQSCDAGKTCKYVECSSQSCGFFGCYWCTGLCGSLIE